MSRKWFVPVMIGVFSVAGCDEQAAELDELEASDEDLEAAAEFDELEAPDEDVDPAAELEAYGQEDIVVEILDSLEEQEALDPSQFDIAAASDASAAMTGWRRVTKTQGFFNCPSNQTMWNAAFSYCGSRGYNGVFPGTLSSCFHVNGWPSLRRRFFDFRCTTGASG